MRKIRADSIKSSHIAEIFGDLCISVKYEPLIFLLSQVMDGGCKEARPMVWVAVVTREWVALWVETTKATRAT